MNPNALGFIPSATSAAAFAQSTPSGLNPHEGSKSTPSGLTELLRGSTPFRVEAKSSIPNVQATTSFSMEAKSFIPSRKK